MEDLELPAREVSDPAVLRVTHLGLADESETFEPAGFQEAGTMAELQLDSGDETAVAMAVVRGPAEVQVSEPPGLPVGHGEEEFTLAVMGNEGQAGLHDGDAPCPFGLAETEQGGPVVAREQGELDSPGVEGGGLAPRRLRRPRLALFSLERGGWKSTVVPGVESVSDKLVPAQLSG